METQGTHNQPEVDRIHGKYREDIFYLLQDGCNYELLSLRTLWLGQLYFGNLYLVLGGCQIPWPSEYYS